MKSQRMTPWIRRTERPEKHATPCRWLEFQVVIVGKVRLSIRKVVVQVDNQRPDALTAFLSKLNALTGVVTAGVVVGFVVHSRLVPDNLNIFAVLRRYTRKLGRFRDDLLSYRIVSFERG
jgi:hypothetical protein